METSIVSPTPLSCHGLQGPYRGLDTPGSVARPKPVTRLTYAQIDELLDEMQPLWPYNFNESTTDLARPLEEHIREPRPLFIHKVSANSYYSQDLEPPESPLTPASELSSEGSTWSVASSPTSSSNTTTSLLSTPQMIYEVQDSLTEPVLPTRHPRHTLKPRVRSYSPRVLSPALGPSVLSLTEPTIPTRRTSLLMSTNFQPSSSLPPNSPQLITPSNVDTISSILERLPPIIHHDEADTDSDVDLIPPHPAVRPFAPPVNAGVCRSSSRKQPSVPRSPTSASTTSSRRRLSLHLSVKVKWKAPETP